MTESLSDIHLYNYTENHMNNTKTRKYDWNHISKEISKKGPQLIWIVSINKSYMIYCLTEDITTKPALQPQ